MQTVYLCGFAMHCGLVRAWDGSSYSAAFSFETDVDQHAWAKPCPAATLCGGEGRDVTGPVL